MIKMPPQAYTKEVLAAAFDWLADQPEYVRQKIASSDDLVGTYLKSTRLKTEFNRDLSSAKNFRNELQDLAQNLKQFEEKEEKPKPQPVVERFERNEIPESLMQSFATPSNSIPASSMPSSFNPAAVTLSKEAQIFKPTQHIPMSEEKEMVRPQSVAPIAAKAQKLADGEVVFKIDQKTQKALDLAKDKLNLSSDSEALRVLVSLGEKHLKKLFTSED